MWVLIRNEDEKYVCPPGQEKSYSSRLQDARQFPTKDKALADACGNERAVSVDSILQR